MARSLPQNDEAPAPTRRIPSAAFNSVSTRIIASVFLATVLTAAVVSGLCIRAIHAEQSGRLVRGFASLSATRETAWSRRAQTLAAQLRLESAPDSAWHAALSQARSREPESPRPSLRWQSPDRRVTRPSSANELTEDELPAPPETLAAHFDRIVLGDADGATSTLDDCLAIEAELPGDAVVPAGRLTACIAPDELTALLRPGPEELATPRVMLTDLRGSVLSAGGPGAPARVGGRIPIGQMIGHGRSALSHYSDPAGRALVGLASPLGRSGWFLAVETEHARAFAPAIALTRTIFIVDVCVILLFSVLAYKVTVAIMQPIHALSSGAQRILEGHVDHQIPPPAIHDDELGLLTHTFNEMMRKLRSNQIEIERDRIRLAEKNEELQSANEVLSQLSITDGLTKLHNHRYFQDHLTREIKRVSRTNSPLSLILIDIDDFKLLNDTHGHAAGDEVLITLATIMNESARESDLIARYGGEEFVILMPNTDLAGAVHLAEKIRMAVESTRLIIGDRMKPTVVTISLGVALFKGNRREFFAEADRALYRAKAAGKNCVIIAGSESNALG
ncbi:MAG: diguanylate cyclase [Deltaproteobacteria bacterium]|nr:diguanylate cyclase [Deltaproteobacteria bacterium]